MTFASGLLYDFDSDVVKPTARQNLRALATSLEKYPESDLLILGHTDSVGTDAYNKSLSVRRADAAAEYLVSRGVARSRIGTGGLGEEEPVATNADAAGRRRNRRVEVAIYASKQLQEEARRKAGRCGSRTTTATRGWPSSSAVRGSAPPGGAQSCTRIRYFDADQNSSGCAISTAAADLAVLGDAGGEVGRALARHDLVLLVGARQRDRRVAASCRSP